MSGARSCGSRIRGNNLLQGADFRPGSRRFLPLLSGSISCDVLSTRTGSLGGVWLVIFDAIHHLKTLYHAAAPFWFQSSVWATEAMLSDPILYAVLAAVLFLEWKMPAIRQQRPV